MSPSQSAVVTIFGKTYTLSTEGQDVERIRETAQLVDFHMREAAGDDQPPSPVQTAVLAGLNLVDELFALQTAYTSTEADIALRTSRLTASLGRLFEQVAAESDG